MMHQSTHMEADLILSRPSYRAGTPVVGTVRLRRANEETNDHTQRRRPIRDDVASARLYLAGRAYLGGNDRRKVSRWRSAQEINQLKKIYGEHACLTMAKMDERSRWNDEWADNGGLGDAPEVTHVEQAERVVVHSSLHHTVPPAKAKRDGSSSNDANTHQPSSNGYSHLPTPHENNAICFWMTNVLEILGIPERHLDRRCTCAAEPCQCQLRPGRGRYHGDMDPYRPLQLPDLDVIREACNDMEKNQSRTKKRKDDQGAGPRSSTDAYEHSPRLGKRSEDEKEENLQEEEGGVESTAAMAETSTHSAWEQIAASAQSRDGVAKNNDAYSGIPLEDLQLAVSFRADLPPDVAPTMSAECVKYFYSAVLVVTTTRGKLLVTQCPFAVVTSNSQHSPRQQTHQTSTTRVHIGDLHAIAHSAGLPTYISSTEASDATPTQLRVISNPPACDIVSRRTAEQRTSTHRIVDEKGFFCGLMTLVGIGGPLVPGTRLGIRVQFPIYDDDESSNGAGIIPCHRVCCALVGEEYAIFEGSSASSAGGDNSQKTKKRVKTRSYVFDSDYEMVDYGYTESISMGLVLPLDCPVSVYTDLVEVTVRLKVEFTVSSRAITSQRSGDGIEGQGQDGFNTIRLDLPCEVIHVDSEADDYCEEGGEEERHISSMRTMQLFWKHDDKSAVADANGFDDTDIQSDLKMLSLRLHEELRGLGWHDQRHA